MEQLPVPPLQQTVDKFLRSAEPLAAAPEEMERVRALAERFVAEEGPVLQADLERRAAERDHWLEEWWNQLAYLSWPDPIFPQEGVSLRDDILGRPLPQLERAASLAAALTRFWHTLKSGALPANKAGGREHCMWQYWRVFGCCRLPGAESDSWAPPRPGRHIVVSCKGQFYMLDVLDVGGRVLGSCELVPELRSIQRDASRREPDNVGSLTTARRPQWARARAELLAGAGCNAVALRAIESALFLLCLDDTVPEEGITGLERETMAGAYTGGRWVDKPFSLVVFGDGRAGATLEHSHLDGAPLAHALDWMAASIRDDGDPLQPQPRGTAAPPRRLRFELSDAVRAAIGAAQSDFQQRRRDFCLTVHHFRGYGSETPKAVGLSPDGFFQMALQLAYFRVFGASPATYESVATTRFLRGRTETARSLSVEAAAFVRDPTAAGLRAAVRAHARYCGECAAGQGIDRHLLGLRVAAQERGLQVAFLQDPLVARSSTFQLSTSQLRCGLSSHAVGFPPPAVPSGGVGVCYMCLPREFRMTVTRSAAAAEREGVSSAAFAAAIEAALTEMEGMCVAEARL